MTGFVYQRLKLAIASGEIQWDDPDLDVGLALVNAAGSFDPDPTVDSYLALDGLLDGTVPGYTPGQVAGRTVERDDGPIIARWQADDVVFPAVGPGATAEGAVLFVVNPANDADVWPGLWLPDVAGTLNGTDFTVTFDPDGILRFRAPA